MNEKLFKEAAAAQHGRMAPAVSSTKWKVHTTKHGLMRVYQVMNVSQESKDWVRDLLQRERGRRLSLSPKPKHAFCMTCESVGPSGLRNR